MTEVTIDTFSWITLVWNLIFAYGLKYLWKLVNLLQFAVFISDWNLTFPYYGHIVLKNYKHFVLMEFLPTEKFISFLSELAGLETKENCTDCAIDLRRL